jgi:hypothetical protein
MFKALLIVKTPEGRQLYLDGEVFRTRGHAKDWLKAQIDQLPIFGTDITETSITRISK